MSVRTVISASAAVGLFGGAVVAGTLWQADSRAAAEQISAEPAVREFLRSARLACPRIMGNAQDALVAAASIPEVPGHDGPGRAEVRPTSGGKPDAQITKPGATALAESFPRTADPIVAAEGGLAPGLAAGRLSQDPRGEGQGLASSRCVTPTAETWLVGGSAGPGQRDTLYLINSTQTDSVVDISAYGKGGQLDLSGDEDITVPAGKTKTIRLSAMAPQVADMALRVRTKEGLIAAAVAEDRMEGLTPMGTDILTDAGQPDTHVVLAALPAGPGSRQLHVMAPQEGGTITVTALTPDGEVPVLAGEPIRLQRKHLMVLDVTKDLAERAAAIRITGDVPVVASAAAATAVDETLRAEREEAVADAEAALKAAKGRAERAKAQAALAKADTANAIDPGEDVAWFGAAPELTGTSAITPLRADLDASVSITATAGDAKVTVSALAATSDPARLEVTKDIEVRDSATVAVPLRAPKGAKVYTVVVDRTSGPGKVHVGNVQSDDRRSLTGYAVHPLAIWVPLPAAQPDYSTDADTQGQYETP